MKKNNQAKTYRNQVAKSFRDIADHDYISARTLLRFHCFDQFLFYSQQCIEKYLKTLLLFNGINNNNSSHDLMSLLNKCQGIDTIHFCDMTKKTIGILDGFEHVRYLTYPILARSKYLLCLDEAAFDIRRFCHSDEKRINAFLKADKGELKKFARKFEIVPFGELEKILKNKTGKYKILRDNLIWKNFYYGRNIKKTISFPERLWMKNSPIFGTYPAEGKECYEAVKDYIFLPSKVRKHFEKPERVAEV